MAASLKGELMLSKLFYSPTDAQVNCLKNNFKIYIKIDIKTAPTYFGAVTPIPKFFSFVGSIILSYFRLLTPWG
jgi:hypothetical protein